MERSYRQTKVQQNKQRYVHFSVLPPRQKRPTEFRCELKFPTTWSRHEIRKLVPDNWFPEIQKNLIRLGNPDRVVFDRSRELPWILSCLRWWWQEWIHTGLPLLCLHQPRCHLCLCMEVLALWCHVLWAMQEQRQSLVVFFRLNWFCVTSTTT